MAKILPKLLKELQAICGEEGLSLSEVHRIAYSRDASTSAFIQIREGHIAHLPDLVVWPRSTEQVSQILKVAHRHRVPLVPFGAGSGVSGGTIPLRGGIVMDLKRMDRVLSLDSRSLTVTAQTGILGEIFEHELQKAGYTLGHFPASIYMASLGGFLACRSAGQLSTKYGKIEDRVQAFTVCLADGRVIHIGAPCHPHPSPLPSRERVAIGRERGLDLRELFLGSEGTLGVITEATLKIHPQPEAKKYFGFRFPNLAQGLNAIRHFMQAGLRPAVVRLYDPLDSFLFSLHSSPSEAKEEDFMKKICRLLPKKLKTWLSHFKRYSFQKLLSQSRLLNVLIDLNFSSSLLILGFEGPLWKVEWESAAVRKICGEEGKFLGEEVGLSWLKRRYSMGYWMSPIIEQGCFADTMEVAASWSNLEDLYREVRRAIGGEVLIMAHFSHMYPEGASIYFTFAGYAPDEERRLKLHREIWEKALTACLKAGGTISHHHGIGYLKAKKLPEELGPWMGWFKKTKWILDPKGILNPGKMGL